MPTLRAIAFLEDSLEVGWALPKILKSMRNTLMPTVGAIASLQHSGRSHLLKILQNVRMLDRIFQDSTTHLFDEILTKSGK
jgi:hypothetical protein